MTTSLLKQYLLQIHHFEFTATTTLGINGWQGIGKGEVIVEQLDEQIYLFHEKGTFWTHGKAINCYNTYRWTFQKDLVQLEHLRFGKENPVHLFYMQGRQDNTMVSVCPHVCDKDLYQAYLELTDKSIELTWRIEGNEKDETITYQYSP